MENAELTAYYGHLCIFTSCRPMDFTFTIYNYIYKLVLLERSEKV